MRHELDLPSQFGSCEEENIYNFRKVLFCKVSDPVSVIR